LVTFLKKSRGSYRQKSIKAVIPVHLYGQPADMNVIMDIAAEFGLQVVEDCAQSHLADWNGVKTGNFGLFGAFSFYPGKNLGAWGEAGALVTNDEELYQKADCLRRHGEVQRYVHRYVGHNYRMENFQGAVLGVKLRHLQQWTVQRRANADMYERASLRHR
jgi:dTDP-4-amino-4,6-dideoxygalactose transaminase